jgi:hypothetical protein
MAEASKRPSPYSIANALMDKPLNPYNPSPSMGSYPAQSSSWGKSGGFLGSQPASGGNQTGQNTGFSLQSQANSSGGSGLGIFTNQQQAQMQGQQKQQAVISGIPDEKKAQMMGNGFGGG